MAATLHYTMQEWAGVALEALVGRARRAVLIYNPVAGGGSPRRRAALEQTAQILLDGGIAAELTPTRAAGHARELARGAAEDGRDLVIVAGGDGTINEAVNGLAGSRVPLAVLPAGTANVLGHELGIPNDFGSAARLILSGTPRRIALGLATSPEGKFAPRYFFALAGAGPDAALMLAVDAKTKLRLGILAYWLEGFRLLTRYRFPKFRVIGAGGEHEATLAVIGRTKHYGGAFQVTTEADLLEDAFEVMTYGAAGPWSYLRGLPKLVCNRVRELDHMRHWKTRAVRCEAVGDERIYAQVDGEPLGELPVEFRIVPDALTLVFPETCRARLT